MRLVGGTEAVVCRGSDRDGMCDDAIPKVVFRLFAGRFNSVAWVLSFSSYTEIWLQAKLYSRKQNTGVASPGRQGSCYLIGQAASALPRHPFRHTQTAAELQPHGGGIAHGPTDQGFSSSSNSFCSEVEVTKSLLNDSQVIHP